MARKSVHDQLVGDNQHTEMFTVAVPLACTVS